jgi:trehalose 6-phosphate phosphatase
MRVMRFLYLPQYFAIRAERMEAETSAELRGVVRPEPPHAGLRLEELALFLDVDGTLLEIAPTPDRVVVEPELQTLLRTLVARTNGAVAFVSGRSIAVLDGLFHPLQLPAAGLHGFERRSANGTYHRRRLPPGELLSKGRETLRAFVACHPRLVLEDKRFAIAVHYRQAMHLEQLVLREVSSVAAMLAPDFEIQRGKCVVELRPAGASKASAIAEFMKEPPFTARRPVCLGDDITDESAFEWVNAHGGITVAVGTARHTAAVAHLHSVRAARLWLTRLAEAS